jgi:hypothetical protein
MNLYRVSLDVLKSEVEQEEDYLHLGGYVVANNFLVARKKMMKYYFNHQDVIATGDVHTVHLEVEEQDDDTFIVPEQIISLNQPH